MKAMLETTVWDDSNSYNHLYWMDGDKAIAYSKWGEESPLYFSKPLTIDTRGRKFVEVKQHPFNGVTPSSVVRVEGSKGNVYEVNTEERTCTCPAFKFRGGNCKHVKEICGE